jgi:cytochrome c oxidase subunit 2
MTTTCEVLDPARYSAKMAELANIFVDPSTKKRLDYKDVGEKLYKMSGCSQCHTINGTPGTGPTWKGLYKSDVAFDVAPAGYKLTPQDDDEKWTEYLRESILKPSAKVVHGFQNVMPPQEAQFSGSPVKEKKLQAIVEFIKSLDSSGTPPHYYKPMPIPPDIPEKGKAAATGAAQPPAAETTAPPSKATDESVKTPKSPAAPKATSEGK